MQCDKQVFVPPARCSDCGKLRFFTRANAKAAARRARGTGANSARFRVYQSCGGGWHLASWQPEGQVTFYREEQHG